MGIYYNPPDDIPRIGRLLHAGDYDALVAQLSEGEVIIALYDAPHAYLAAPLIDSAAELQRQEWGGSRLTTKFYAVPRAEAEAGFARAEGGPPGSSRD